MNEHLEAAMYLPNLDAYIQQGGDSMTTVTFHRIGEVEVNADGRVITVPTMAFGHDQDLRDIVGRAMQNPGVAVPVPTTARVPRPRHSKVYGISL
jgi:hypothetical protein